VGQNAQGRAGGQRIRWAKPPLQKCESGYWMGATDAARYRRGIGGAARTVALNISILGFSPNFATSNWSWPMPAEVALEMASSYEATAETRIRTLESWHHRHDHTTEWLRSRGVQLDPMTKDE